MAQPAMSILIHSHLFLLYTSLFFILSPATTAKNPTKQCTNTTCGDLQIPFPFYIDNNATNPTNCTTPLAPAFRLTCVNSTLLFLTIAAESYRVLHFFPDGVLVDFPNTSTCRQYNDLRSFDFSANDYFAISIDNVLDLYDCEDSSLCKPDCEKTTILAPPGCNGNRATYYPSCCYPLSDRSESWQPGDGFSGFASRFGCRGFSSWVVLPGGIGKRGVKLEWGVPARNATCVANADVVNASFVESGIRCQCHDGYVGDGFKNGVGCIKSCSKDGKEDRGDDCYYDQNNSHRKKAIILAGVLTSALTAVSLTALFCFLKKRRFDKFASDEAQHVLSKKASKLFTYHELEEATKGFDDRQKIVDGPSTTMYTGVLTGESNVVVQKVQCSCERDLIQVLLRIEALSAVSHRNIAQILGWSIDSGSYTPLVVYEYPENGTLQQHLRLARDDNVPLDWYKRLNIAAETACILAFLHHEISPPIFHCDLHSGCIFLDSDHSVKLAGFHLQHPDAGKNDVYEFGLVLLDIITGGNTTVNFSTMALQKIKSGKLEEIVDPSLYYHEQTPFRRDQIDKIADLAMRCLLFGADGKLGAMDVARELFHITKDSVDGSSRRGPALEETFSNSSLLQMISMSPDSVYLPKY